jgi:DNA-binding winged helix-turn-helix (wHTH) protein
MESVKPKIKKTMKTSVNGFSISEDLKSASKKNKTISLTPTESRALGILISGELVEISTIEETIWPSGDATDHSVRKLMSDIRRKFDNTKCIKNYRGKGYQLIIDVSLNSLPIPLVAKKKKSADIKWISIITRRLLPLLAVGILVTTAASTTYKQNTKNTVPVYKSIFRSTDTLFDFNGHKNKTYVSSNTQEKGEIIKLDRTNETMYSTEAGMITNFSISDNGKSTIQVVSSNTCNIHIFNGLFTNPTNNIPCLPKSTLNKVKWTSEDEFIFTYMPEDNISARVHKYNLTDNSISRINNLGIDYTTNNGGGDYFFELYKEGILSLRLDANNKASLHYTSKTGSKSLLTFNSTPFSFVLDKDSVLYFDQDGALMELTLNPRNPLKSKNTPAVNQPAQALHTYFPKIIEGKMHFYIGEGFHKVVKSATTGSIIYDPTFTVKDISPSESGINTISTSRDGYKLTRLEPLKHEESFFITTTENISEADTSKGVWFLGGPDGLYTLINGELIKLSDKPTLNIAGTNDCLLIETPNGIYKLENNTEITLVSEKGKNLKSLGNSCIFENKVTNEIVDHLGETIYTKKNDSPFYIINNQITTAIDKGKSVTFKNMDTNEDVLEINDILTDQKVVSVDNETYYLSIGETYNQLIEIN